MNTRNRLTLLASLLSGIASTSLAVTVLPGDPNWGSESSGGGSSVITGSAPRSGAGSLELFGDRTRFMVWEIPIATPVILGFSAI